MNASLIFTPVTGTKKDQSLPASVDEGATVISARQIMVDADFPDGRNPKCEMLILFDPQTGHFTWGINQASGPSPR